MSDIMFLISIEVCNYIIPCEKQKGLLYPSMIWSSSNLIIYITMFLIVLLPTIFISWFQIRSFLVPKYQDKNLLFLLLHHYPCLTLWLCYLVIGMMSIQRFRIQPNKVPLQDYSLNFSCSCSIFSINTYINFPHAVASLFYTIIL